MAYRLLREDIDPCDYVWPRNGERRDLTKSKRALAIAELVPLSGPGRPRTVAENFAVLQKYGRRTTDRTARQRGFSTRLLSDAAKVADQNGPATPELRDAVRQGLVSVTGAANGTVLKPPRELQQQAVALVRNGEARTVAAAVKRISENPTTPDYLESPAAAPYCRFRGACQLPPLLRGRVGRIDSARVGGFHRGLSAPRSPAQGILGSGNAGDQGADSYSESDEI